MVRARALLCGPHSVALAALLNFTNGLLAIVILLFSLLRLRLAVRHCASKRRWQVNQSPAVCPGLLFISHKCSLNLPRALAQQGWSLRQIGPY